MPSRKGHHHKAKPTGKPTGRDSSSGAGNGAASGGTLASFPICLSPELSPSEGKCTALGALEASNLDQPGAPRTCSPPAGKEGTGPLAAVGNAVAGAAGSVKALFTGGQGQQEPQHPAGGPGSAVPWEEEERGRGRGRRGGRSRAPGSGGQCPVARRGGCEELCDRRGLGRRRGGGEAPASLPGGQPRGQEGQEGGGGGGQVEDLRSSIAAMSAISHPEACLPLACAVVRSVSLQAPL